MAVPPPPPLLKCLHDSLDTDEQGWLADCPICTCEGMTIRPDKAHGIWVFGCQDGCPHEEVVEWLQCDVRFWGQQEDEMMDRAWVAMQLAPTLDICRALLANEPVVRTALDPEWAEPYQRSGLLANFNLL